MAPTVNRSKQKYRISQTYLKYGIVHTFSSLKLAHELEERLVFADLQHFVLQRSGKCWIWGVVRGQIVASNVIGGCTEANVNAKC
jgi:hypothetical protein